MCVCVCVCVCVGVGVGVNMDNSSSLEGHITQLPVYKKFVNLSQST